MQNFTQKDLTEVKNIPKKVLEGYSFETPCMYKNSWPVYGIQRVYKYEKKSIVAKYEKEKNAHMQFTINNKHFNNVYQLIKQRTLRIR